MLPTTPENNESAEFSARESVPGLGPVRVGSHNMNCAIAPGSLNTARLFGASRSNDSVAQGGLGNRRRRRSSLPTVCEAAETNQGNDAVQEEESLAELRACASGEHPQSLEDYCSELRPAPPPAGDRPAARGPRVHTPLPADLVASLGGRSAGWLTRRSHLRNVRNGPVNLFGAEPSGPRDPSRMLHNSLSARSSSFTSGTSGCLQPDMTDPQLGAELLCTNRKPVAGRRARPQVGASVLQHPVANTVDVQTTVKPVQPTSPENSRAAAFGGIWSADAKLTSTHTSFDRG